MDNRSSAGISRESDAVTLIRTQKEIIELKIRMKERERYSHSRGWFFDMVDWIQYKEISAEAEECTTTREDEDGTNPDTSGVRDAVGLPGAYGTGDADIERSSDRFRR